MTPERAKELLPVIQAFAEGKAIQAKVLPNSHWADCTDLLCKDYCEYRIKPEKTKVWVNIYKSACGKPVLGAARSSKHEADNVATHVESGGMNNHSRIACIPITFEEGEGL